MRLCATTSKTCPARAGVALVAGPAHGQRAILKVRMLPWFRSSHPVESRSIEKAAIPCSSREGISSTPGSERRDAIPWLRLDSVSAQSPAHRGETEANPGTAWGCPIARRSIAACCLFVFKTRQFGANSLQIVSGREPSKNQRVMENVQSAGVDIEMVPGPRTYKPVD